MAFRPPCKFRDPPEAEFFVHFRRLEIIARDKDAPDVTFAGFFDEGLEKRARVAAAAKRLIDPHLSEFGDAAPGITGGGRNQLPVIVSDHEREALTIAVSRRCAIVRVE